jgi:GDPmannose 4,6-dehydratase
VIALITGITGQDGSYLAELLLSKGYIVHGIKRRSSSINTERIDHIYDHPNFELHYGDLTDGMSIMNLMNRINPDEVYNLGAMSHVQVSFENAEYTANVNALGTLRLLEAIRILGLKTKFYQASTSELFGNSLDKIQNENTPFNPMSPYATSKLFAYWITRNYREAYDIFAVNGILFNHESPRRGETFVTRKITRFIAKWLNNKEGVLRLGNINSIRDFGHAKDYVQAMWMMLQQEVPKDLVIATGVTCSVKEFIEKAFLYVGYDIEWTATGGYVDGKRVVMIDKKYLRKNDVTYLNGDSTLARDILKWNPKINLDDLIHDMINSELHNNEGIIGI